MSSEAVGAPGATTGKPVTIQAILEGSTAFPNDLESFQTFCKLSHCEEIPEYIFAVQEYRNFALPLFSGAGAVGFGPAPGVPGSYKIARTDSSNSYDANPLAATASTGSLPTSPGGVASDGPTSPTVEDRADSFGAKLVKASGEESRSARQSSVSLSPMSLSIIGSTPAGVTGGGGRKNSIVNFKKSFVRKASSAISIQSLEQREQCRKALEAIIDKFLTPGSNHEINLHDKVRKKIITDIRDKKLYHPDTVFKVSVDKCVEMLRSDKLRAFLAYSAALVKGQTNRSSSSLNASTGRASAPASAPVSAPASEKHSPAPSQKSKAGTSSPAAPRKGHDKAAPGPHKGNDLRMTLGKSNLASSSNHGSQESTSSQESAELSRGPPSKTNLQSLSSDASLFLPLSAHASGEVGPRAKSNLQSKSNQGSRELLGRPTLGKSGLQTETSLQSASDAASASTASSPSSSTRGSHDNLPAALAGVLAPRSRSAQSSRHASASDVSSGHSIRIVPRSSMQTSSARTSQNLSSSRASSAGSPEMLRAILPKGALLPKAALGGAGGRDFAGAHSSAYSVQGSTEVFRLSPGKAIPSYQGSREQLRVTIGKSSLSTSVSNGASQERLDADPPSVHGSSEALDEAAGAHAYRPGSSLRVGTPMALSHFPTGSDPDLVALDSESSDGSPAPSAKMRPQTSASSLPSASNPRLFAISESAHGGSLDAPTSTDSSVASDISQMSGDAPLEKRRKKKGFRGFFGSKGSLPSDKKPAPDTPPAAPRPKKQSSSKLKPGPGAKDQPEKAGPGAATVVVEVTGFVTISTKEMVEDIGALPDPAAGGSDDAFNPRKGSWSKATGSIFRRSSTARRESMSSEAFKTLPADISRAIPAETPKYDH